EFLEACAARRAAQRIDAAGIARLRAILAEQARAVKQRDAAGYVRSNAEVHRLIAQAAGNGRLAQMLAMLENQMRIALHRVAGEESHMRAGYEEHGKILAAIAARDAERAERAMRAHIAHTIARVREVQRTRQAAGEGRA